MAHKKRYSTLTKGVLAATVIAGTANPLVLYDAAGHYRKYASADDAAKTAQSAADNAEDSIAEAGMRLREAREQEWKEWGDFRDAENGYATDAQKRLIADRALENARLVVEREADLNRKERGGSDDGLTLRDQAYVLNAKAQHERHVTEGETIPLAAFDATALAIGLKKLLDARTRSKVNSYLAGIERMREREDSHLARYDAEIDAYMKGKRSL